MSHRPLLRAPFPWFGGKSRVAGLVWARFGPVRNYVEPFAGSLAVLLGRPWEPAIETVNDQDAYLSNFWRAVAADPEEVAQHAAWPVNEVDLHARHRWLVETARERVERCLTDPEYFDAKVAGWWVWGQCLWIGSGWCSRPEWTGRFKLSAKPGSGVLRSSLAATSRGIQRPQPILQHGEGGRGVLRQSHGQIPGLSGNSGAGGLYAYMQALSDRLRRVRVCCGDFERLLGPAVTTCIGTTGVFLDPPYPLDGRAVCYSHDSADVWWRAYQWAIDNGDNPELRIALCGYDGRRVPARLAAGRVEGQRRLRTQRARPGQRAPRADLVLAALLAGRAGAALGDRRSPQQLAKARPISISAPLPTLCAHRELHGVRTSARMGLSEGQRNPERQRKERQMNANETRYTVIVKDGEVVDKDLRPIMPAVRTSCGHNHKTYEAATRCQAHLRNLHRERSGAWVESAVWYNSQIHEHAGDSMAYLGGAQ